MNEQKVTPITVAKGKRPLEQTMQAYACSIIRVREIGDELDGEFRKLARLEDELRSEHLTPPHVEFGRSIDAALQAWKGDPTLLIRQTRP